MREKYKNLRTFYPLSMLYKKIKKTLFPCCNTKHKLRNLLRPTKHSSKNHPINHHSKKKANHNENNKKNNILLSEVKEIKPKNERFYLDITKYPLNEIITAGYPKKQLLLRVSEIKLTANKRPNKKTEKFGMDNDNIMINEDNISEIGNDIRKYYQNRYILFSRFDQGVKMDHEAWFSTTPEVIAEYLARRIGGGTILDAFCGVGGNAIQFAKYCNFVIANDIDPQKISFARHNGRIYEVEKNIQFLNQDFLTLNFACEQNIDIVFLAPPWGGINYSGDEAYSVLRSVTPDITAIMKKTLDFSKKFILCLPRNINVEEILGLIVDSFEEKSQMSERASVEIEKVFINNKFKMNLIYFGNATKIARSIEYSHIYGKILRKKEKGFDYKEKEQIKNMIEKFGMIKILNLVEWIDKNKGRDEDRLALLCEMLDFN